MSKNDVFEVCYWYNSILIGSVITDVNTNTLFSFTQVVGILSALIVAVSLISIGGLLSPLPRVSTVS